MTKAVYRPRTAGDVASMFDFEPCRICPDGKHMVNFPPGSVTCSICDPLPNGRPRRHYHQRKNSRRRLRHIINQKWTP